MSRYELVDNARRKHSIEQLRRIITRKESKMKSLRRKRRLTTERLIRYENLSIDVAALEAGVAALVAMLGTESVYQPEPVEVENAKAN